ncbi:hypothetical protein HK098_005618 [Nowakowskiella sp. JEL0407]|nr:hypothetical protein HK098_005618 [Nowakowskiella sp. JEL0407]
MRVFLFFLGPYVLWLLKDVEDNYLIARDVKWLIILDIPCFIIYLVWQFRGLSQSTPVNGVALWGGICLVWHQYVTVIIPILRAREHSKLVEKLNDRGKRESESSIVSFVKKAKQKVKRDIESDDIKKFKPVLSQTCYYKVLNDPGAILNEFSVKDFCVENTLFYSSYRSFFIECCEYGLSSGSFTIASLTSESKSIQNVSEINPASPSVKLPEIPVPESLKNIMQEIYITFILPGSDFELNLPNKRISKIKAQFQKPKNDQTSQPTIMLNVFDEIRTDVSKSTL